MGTQKTPTTLQEQIWNHLKTESELFIGNGEQYLEFEIRTKKSAYLINAFLIHSRLIRPGIEEIHDCECITLDIFKITSLYSYRLCKWLSSCAKEYIDNKLYR